MQKHVTNVEGGEVARVQCDHTAVDRTRRFACSIPVWIREGQLVGQVENVDKFGIVKVGPVKVLRPDSHTSYSAFTFKRLEQRRTLHNEPGQVHGGDAVVLREHVFGEFHRLSLAAVWHLIALIAQALECLSDC